jgi:hypothetical protein
LFLVRKITPRMWEREAVIEGIKFYEWSQSYEMVCTGFHACTWVSMEIAMYVHGLQWELSRTYMGCNGNSHVHTRVVVGIVV